MTITEKIISQLNKVDDIEKRISIFQEVKADLQIQIEEERKRLTEKADQLSKSLINGNPS